MFCTVVWKVAKGVLVEKIEKKTKQLLRSKIYLCCLCTNIKYRQIRRGMYAYS